MGKFRVFFSSRSTDSDRVKDLKATLAELLPLMPLDDVSANVPWVDDWKIPASSVLQECDGLVCVVGSDTHESEPVDWEIRHAHELGKPLVVTRVSHDCKLPSSCHELRIEAMDWDVAELAGRIGELLVTRALFLNQNPTAPMDSNLIWNQYNLMVQSSEALVSRRQTVNTLYVSASAALLAGIGVLVSSISDSITAIGAAGWLGVAAGVCLLAFLGAALSFNWRRTLISYGTLNKAKYKVIAALEAHMPARLFDAEWRVLEARQYKSTTDTDKQTALFFLLLFLSLGLVSAGIIAGGLLQRGA